ncbi:MAG TPA: hypothetical protein VF025_13315 [Gaiellaceae bacterium]
MLHRSSLGLEKRRRRRLFVTTNNDEAAAKSKELLEAVQRFARTR